MTRSSQLIRRYYMRNFGGGDWTRWWRIDGASNATGALNCLILDLFQALGCWALKPYILTLSNAAVKRTQPVFGTGYHQWRRNIRRLHSC